MTVGAPPGALRTVEATRYVTPLREGGSLPALVEGDDDGFYVCKFRGAGQGPKALVAELVAGEIARAVGLPVPELVLMRLDPALGAAEPDPEIQELIGASAGLNLALDFLPGALPFDPASPPAVTPELAADVVWFDAYVSNVDRTPRNSNLLVWHGALWLIDHGAALYVHHAPAWTEMAGRRFAGIREHVLLPFAGSVADADLRLAPRLSREVLEAIAALIPPGWLGEDESGDYVAYLEARLAGPRGFAEEAEAARRRP